MKIPNPILNWLASREEVRLATTQAEREAIYGLRYEVYAVEKAWVDCGEDHAHRRVADAWDEAPTTRHIISTDAQGVRGAARMQVFPPGQVPEKWARMYSLHLFPGIEKLCVAELGRFVIRSDCRGGMAMPSIILFGFNHLLGIEKADLGFCECRPSMVRHYRKMGYRPYRAPVIEDPDGLTLPLVCVPSDDAYMGAVGAFTRADAKKHFGRGRRPALDASAFAHLFAEDEQRMIVEEREVFAALEDGRRAPDTNAPTWARELPPEVFEQAARRGFLLAIGAGDLLIGEGRSETEGYFILDGECEVTCAGVRVAVLGPGEPVGEMAILLEDGRRTASVRALQPTRLLVLDRRFMDDLHRDSPDAAYHLLRVIGGVLSRRLAEMTRQRAEAMAATREA